MLTSPIAQGVRCWFQTFNGCSAWLLQRALSTLDDVSFDNIASKRKATDSTSRQRSDTYTGLEQSCNPAHISDNKQKEDVSLHQLLQQQVVHTGGFGMLSHSTQSQQQALTDDSQAFSPSQLTRDIKQTAGPEELLQLIQQHSQELNYIHISAALTQAGQWHRKQQLRAEDKTTLGQLLFALEQLMLASDHLQQCGPREVANIIWSCSLLRYTNTPLYSRCLQEFMAKLPLVRNLQDVSIVLYGLAEADQHITQSDLDCMLGITADVDLLERAASQALNNIVYSAARLGLLIPQHQLERLVSCLIDKLAECQPQGIANTLWGVATMRQQLSAQQLHQLLDYLIQKLSHAKPEEIAITLWAVAMMREQLTAHQLHRLLGCLVSHVSVTKPRSVAIALWAVAAMGQQVPVKQLQQLVDCFMLKLSGASFKNVAYTLWAVATMGQQLAAQQLLRLLDRCMQQLSAAKPQDISITLWAVATMGQQVPVKQLQQSLGHLISMSAELEPQVISNTLLAVAKMNAAVSHRQLHNLEGLFAKHVTKAKAQVICNVLWSCGELQHFPQQLLTALQAQQLWQKLIRGMDPHHLSQVVVALGTLGHTDEQVMGAVLQEAIAWTQQQQGFAITGATAYCSYGGSLNASQLQAICNLCWSVASLDLQQYIPEVMTLVDCYGQHVMDCHQHQLMQLQQVDLWLLDVQQADSQGLSSVLSADQLRRCRSAWIDQLQHTVAQEHSQFQKTVFSAVQQLPLTWHTPPAMEQLCEPDGMFSIDISGVTADGVRLAIEADGPTHFIRPDNKPTGPTLYRNRALAARGYVVVSVPYFEWNRPAGLEQKQQYLDSLLQQQVMAQTGKLHHGGSCLAGKPDAMHRAASHE